VSGKARIDGRPVEPRPGERVLDAGAGLGRLALLIAPQVRALVCLDLSRGALSVLEAQAAAAGIRNVETVQADVCGYGGAPASFDAACCVEVLGHVPSQRERAAALLRIRELLRPGGRCLIGVYAWSRRARRAGMEKEGFWGTGERRLYHYYFTAQELRRALVQAGFEAVRVRGLLLLPGRIARRLPAALAPLEATLSRLPLSARLGTLLLGLARRPLG
jgi:2-polyprenyl-6-hydroxyphenyl methylase/3-demethylubiquinone-9 3-methyltransferase